MSQRYIANAEVYFDTDSNPQNPGWVLRYDVLDAEGEPLQSGLTEALDETELEGGEWARTEAALFLSIPVEKIKIRS